MTDKKRIEFLKKMLSSNARWAVNAMFRVRENQSPDGFDKFDSAIIECYVDRLHNKQNLTINQYTTIFGIMPKYAEQLLKTKTDVEKLDRIIEKAEAVGM